MPRSGKGGARQGTPGQSYANRTDLNAATQPVKVAPSQQYGQAVQQQQAQQAIPLPNNTALSSSPQAPPPASPGVVPGQMPPMNGPSARPSEPVTHGISSGPGGGPEALASDPLAGKMSVMLSQIAQQSGSPDIAALAQRAQSLGQ